MGTKKPQPEKKKIQAELSFNLPEYEWEYVFTTEAGFDIPEDIARTLQLELGDEWDVSNKGSRVEIKNRRIIGARDDEKIKSALQKAVAGRYDTHVAF